MLSFVRSSTGLWSQCRISPVVKACPCARSARLVQLPCTRRYTSEIPARPHRREEFEFRATKFFSQVFFAQKFFLAPSLLWPPPGRQVVGLVPIYSFDCTAQTVLSVPHERVTCSAPQPAGGFATPGTAVFRQPLPISLFSTPAPRATRPNTD